MGEWVVLICCCTVAAVFVTVIFGMRIRRLEGDVERLRRLIEGLQAMGAPRPPTVRVERRPSDPGTRSDTSPRGSRIIEPVRGGAREPSPRGTARLEPSPRGVTRLEVTPRGGARIDGTPQGGLPRLGEHARGGNGWAPSHRICFVSEQGRTDAWLVMMQAGPDGGRIAPTKQEWTAGVPPAWRCDLAGSWTHHGSATPGGARGRVQLEEFRPS